jgi:Icc-related predicted phosphoesterase
MTKLVCVSDTHMAEPNLPAGDILIHAGDLTFRGRPEELGKQRMWLAKQVKKFKKVIVIPGNHDFGFETDMGKYRQEFEQEGIVVLNEQEYIYEGIKYFGSPITPFFHAWAFNRIATDIDIHWDIIPNDTNVLITHGPPYGILDGVPQYQRTQIGMDKHYRPIYSKKFLHTENVGCPSLLERIQQLKQLRFHVFGHIHPGHGQVEINGVKYVNASIMNDDYQPVNKPIVVEI